MNHLFTQYNSTIATAKDNTCENHFQVIQFNNNTVSINEANQIEELFSKRATMCGIGTRKLKNFLNRKAKEGDTVAEILNTALKAEDKRISSMICSSDYRIRNANQAINIISDLLSLIYKNKIGSYGYIDFPYSDYTINSSESIGLLCINLPGNVQIGYIIPRWYKVKTTYNGELINSDKSNLAKIEDAINTIYGKQIEKKYGSSAAVANVTLPNIVIERYENCARIDVVKPYRKSRRSYFVN